MICASCKAGDHSTFDPERLTGCRGGTWCDCQHRTDRQPAVLLGVASPACNCDEQEAWSGEGRGVFAVPPPAGCPAHGTYARWLRPLAEEVEA